MHTVLIVDDEPVVTKSIGNIISRMGINVLVTENGNEALELIRQNHPQLAFLDIKINGLKGTEVLKEAKKIDPAIKIVIITGSISHDVEAEVLANGAIALIKKPFTIHDIQKVLIDTGLAQK